MCYHLVRFGFQVGFKAEKLSLHRGEQIISLMFCGGEKAQQIQISRFYFGKEKKSNINSLFMHCHNSWVMVKTEKYHMTPVTMKRSGSFLPKCQLLCDLFYFMFFLPTLM